MRTFIPGCRIAWWSSWLGQGAAWADGAASFHILRAGMPRAPVGFLLTMLGGYCNGTSYMVLSLPRNSLSVLGTFAGSMAQWGNIPSSHLIHPPPSYKYTLESISMVPSILAKPPNGPRQHGKRPYHAISI